MACLGLVYILFQMNTNYKCVFFLSKIHLLIVNIKTNKTFRLHLVFTFALLKIFYKKKLKSILYCNCIIFYFSSNHL